METTLGEQQYANEICIKKSLMMGCVPWPPLPLGVVGRGCLFSWSLWRRRANLEGAKGCYLKALLALWVVRAATELFTGMECVSWVKHWDGRSALTWDCLQQLCARDALGKASFGSFIASNYPTVALMASRG